MSNYPNMGHCMFENTSRALDQLLAEVKDARSFRDLDLNAHEEEAWDGLIDKMEELTEAMSELEESRNDDDDLDYIGTAVDPMPQEVLEAYDNTALRKLRAMAVEAQDGAADDDVTYLDMLAGACDDLLAARRERHNA